MYPTAFNGHDHHRGHQETRHARLLSRCDGTKWWRIARGTCGFYDGTMRISYSVCKTRLKLSSPKVYWHKDNLMDLSDGLGMVWDVESKWSNDIPHSNDVQYIITSYFYFRILSWVQIYYPKSVVMQIPAFVVFFDIFWWMWT